MIVRTIPNYINIMTASIDLIQLMCQNYSLNHMGYVADITVNVVSVA